MTEAMRAIAWLPSITQQKLDATSCYWARTHQQRDLCQEKARTCMKVGIIREGWNEVAANGLIAASWAGHARIGDWG